MAKLRQVINLKVRIMSLVYTQSCLPRSGDQPKGINPWGLMPRHKSGPAIRRRCFLRSSRET
ncbi:protein of unknown function [Acidithiobacillus ferrivorans]|uniref:Uncharacterized protein n=1 Tax=Acidithiobacillus ferrivorans TaxID=160808 RepID=A0A060URF4_9PROT|nr:hypothetical protein AFERRI_420179 [Acidithiobacillus ferrivorans]SMH66020.1 protein of unknown function [Acidithiobacillus ferrivorans]